MYNVQCAMSGEIGGFYLIYRGYKGAVYAAALNLVLNANFKAESSSGGVWIEMYIKTEYKMQSKTLVTRQRCRYYNPQAAKRKRGIRLCPTGEGAKKRNARAAWIRNYCLIHNNFSVGDWWITLTYRRDSRPETQKDAHKLLMKRLGILQKRLKRRGIKFVYFAATAIGERGAVHHHLIVKGNFDAVTEVYDVWKDLGAVRDFKRIYNLVSDRLVKYFLGNEGEDTGKIFSHSRGMIPPEVSKRVYPAQAFRRNPKPPEGWVVRGLSAYGEDTEGQIYQEYQLIPAAAAKEYDS